MLQWIQPIIPRSSEIFVATNPTASYFISEFLFIQDPQNFTRSNKKLAWPRDAKTIRTSRNYPSKELPRGTEKIRSRLRPQTATGTAKNPGRQNAETVRP